MKNNIDLSKQLIDFSSQKQSDFIDYAGFAPYTRGNNVLPKIPTMINEEHLQEKDFWENFKVFCFENIHFLENNFAEKSNDFIGKHLRKIVSHIQEQGKSIGIIINFSGKNPIEILSQIRALRTAWSYLNVEYNGFENQLIIAIRVTENDFSDLPYILACEADYILANESIQHFILDNEFYIFAYSIDPFGGNSLLEEKTKEKILFYINN